MQDAFYNWYNTLDADEQESFAEAWITDSSERPDTPGPQPRQGSKAAEVPVMEKMEFSSKSPGFSPEVSARVVESGSTSLEAGMAFPSFPAAGAAKSYL